MLSQSALWGRGQGGTETLSTLRIIILICTAQTLGQIGAFSVPALLPTFIDAWELSKTQAGWITGIFYLGYVLSVPVLVALTDRVDPKRVYMFGVSMITIAGLGYAWFADGFWSALLFRAIWGIGWAGTYMPGLKALSDFVEGPRQSRAVAAHAASAGISGALSFVIAGTIAETFGWRWGVALGGLGGLGALVLMAAFLPTRPPKALDGEARALLDFRPVFRNRSAMAYSIGYCVHTLEMSALRNWVVAFLTFAVASEGAAASGYWLAPTAVASGMGLLGVWASVTGNELSIRFGPQATDPGGDDRRHAGRRRARLLCRHRLSAGGGAGVGLCGFDLGRFIVADGRRGRKRAAGPARRDAGRAFDAGIRRRLFRAADAGFRA